MPPRRNVKRDLTSAEIPKNSNLVCEKKKKKKKKIDNFHSYIYKVLKQVHPELSISKNAMSVMNSLIKDNFEKIATEASKLSRTCNRSTLTSDDIQTAVRLHFAGELAHHAVSEGTKALLNYNEFK